VSDTSFYDARIFQEQMDTTLELSRPAVIWKVRVFPDENKWCALYGEDIQNGVAGFGDTPDAATRDFDRNWYAQKLKQTIL